MRTRWAGDLDPAVGARAHQRGDPIFGVRDFLIHRRKLRARSGHTRLGFLQRCSGVEPIVHAPLHQSGGFLFDLCGTLFDIMLGVETSEVGVRKRHRAREREARFRLIRLRGANL